MRGIRATAGAMSSKPLLIFYWTYELPRPIKRGVVSAFLVVGMMLLLFWNYKGQVHQNDLQLIEQIRKKIDPSTGEDYALIAPKIVDRSQNGQSMLIRKIFKGKRGGTFIEAGAYDGEDLSNTLFLERKLGWLGLLVEPDPWSYWSLTQRKRKSASIRSCISSSPYPMKVNLKLSNTMSRIVSESEKKQIKGIYEEVECYPLYSLMLAANLTTLDFLSLDIEGSELKVLKTLPWDSINIRVICAEHKHVPEGADELKKYLINKDYSLRHEVGDDLIFTRNVLSNGH